MTQTGLLVNTFFRGLDAGLPSYGALQMTLPALSLSACRLLFLLEFDQFLFDPLVVVRGEAKLLEKVVAVE